MEKVIENLNKYEKTRLLSARTLQLTENAPPMVEVDTLNAYELAKKEYKEKKIPLRVLRKTVSEDSKEFE